MIGLFFVPIITLSVLIFILIIAFKFPGLWKRKIPFIFNRKIVTSYIGILVFGTIIYFLFVQPKITAEDEFVDVPSMNHITYAYENGDLTTNFIVEEWSISLPNNELSIETGDGIYYMNNWIPVLVEERADQESSAHITLYETATTINGMDLSEEVSLANVELEGTTLVVTETNETTELNFHSIQNEMTLKQFSKDHSRSLFELDFELQSGEQLIVISAPQNVQLHFDEELFDVEYK